MKFKAGDLVRLIPNPGISHKYKCCDGKAIFKIKKTFRKRVALEHNLEVCNHCRNSRATACRVSESLLIAAESLKDKLKSILEQIS